VRKYLEEGRLIGKNGSIMTHGEGYRNATKLMASMKYRKQISEDNTGKPINS